MVLQFKSILDLLKAFPTEQACIDHLTNLRWNGTVISPFDAESKVYECKGNKYKCKSTGKYFNVRTGTIFEDTKMPLQKWFMALYIFSSHKKGISSHQLSRDLDITQKSAWFLLHRLRYAFEHPAFRTIVGDGGNEPNEDVFEIDATYIGGKAKNKHAKERKAQTEMHGRGTGSKIAVLGVLDRNKGVVAMKVESEASKNVEPIIHSKISPNATVITDSHSGYKDLVFKYNHVVVKHNEGEYVTGKFHTNSIEGFWSQMKRGIYGIYHHVSTAHLNAYCDEFTYRYNTRTFTTQHRFDMILTNVSGKRLTYENLINKSC